MRSARAIFIFCLLAVAFSKGCACNSGRGTDDGGGNNDSGVNIPAAAFSIAPSEVTLDITPGSPAAPSQRFKAITKEGVNVTSAVSFELVDGSLGTFNAGTFTANTDHGGTTLVNAYWSGFSATATIHVRLNQTIGDACPGCPTLPTNMPCTDPSHQPQLVYPPDNTMVPPNMNVIETHFTPGATNSVFDITFTNAITNLHVLTQCTTMVTDTRGQATSGCAFSLPQNVWDILVKTNRGGAAVQIMVRGGGNPVTCVGQSAVRRLWLGQEDIVGGLYYWQSVTVGGVPGTTGGIFRYDFGKRNQAPDAFLAANGSRCVGCHFLSRDGLKMTYGADDADSDDEYGDITSNLIDVGSTTKTASSGECFTPSTPPGPGFQSFSPDHSLVIASDGCNVNSGRPSFYLLDGNTYKNATTIPTGGSIRGTQPDWAPDNKSVVYVQPTKYFPGIGGGVGGDDHFVGGSLMSMVFNAGNKSFGTPTILLKSNGENNYYPGYSPDSAFVIFNRAGSNGADADDSFYNLGARVLLMAARAGAQPFEMANLNGQSNSSNSWPRWSTFTQKYNGHTLAWVTFSSTRDYGLRVRNSVKVTNATGQLVDQSNCIPPGSPGSSGNIGPDCHQPQIWMAAIDLTVAAQHDEGGSSDPSYPAFWLPFQDMTAHNHIAQWVAKVVTMNPDGGSCAASGQACSAGGAACCGGYVCSGGFCNLP